MSRRKNDVDVSTMFPLIILAGIIWFISNFLNNTASIILTIIGIVCIITSVYIKNRTFNASMSQIDSMEGIQFERKMKNYFTRCGYETKITPPSGDYGADLVIRKDGITTVVQLKRYNSSVGVKAIQQVVGSKPMYGADKCMVVTNNYFTKAAKKLASANQVELWDRDTLGRNIRLVQDNHRVIDIFSEENTKIISALGIVLLVISFLIGLSHGKTKQNATTTDATALTTVSDSVPSSINVERTYSAISITEGISDSCYLSSNGNYYYSVENTFDGDYSTCWQDGSAGDAIGESLSYYFSETNIGKIDIVNGSRVREGSYYENNRLSVVSIVFYMNDDVVYETTMSFEDDVNTMESSLILDTLVCCNSIEITINSVYSGSDYSETCISEVILYGIVDL